MKKHISDFFLRGLVASGFGPIILGILYLILHRQGIVQTLTVSQASTGIFTLYVLAFIVGGMNVIYRIERLPLMAAITIHGCVLYGCYLATYLVNGWLESGKMPILVFSGIFLAGYLVIWAVIYSIIRKKTAHINELLKIKQQNQTLH